MGKVFIYKDYSLTDELEKAIETSDRRDWKAEFCRTRERIRDIINALDNAVEVMIKEDC